MIRRMAAQHLGANHGRPNDWLEEYYFLLACYGVFTGRFENLQPRERIGALLSAGVATARLSWPRNLASRPRPRLRCLFDGENLASLLVEETDDHEPGNASRWIRS